MISFHIFCSFLLLVKELLTFLIEEKMNKSEIGLNAGKVWQLLSDYTRWSYGSLKRKSGLKDKELGAALGWLAREDKIEIHQEEDELYVSLGVNVYIG